MMIVRHARCSCGRLDIKCQGEPARVSICHCYECQKRTGSVFGVQAWFPVNHVSKVDADSAEFVRVGDSGGSIAFRFCRICGSTVYWKAEIAPDLIAVAVGAFADQNFPAPNNSVWERRRHSWTAIPEAAVQSN